MRFLLCWLCFTFAATSQAAMLRGPANSTPAAVLANPSAYLRIEQTKPSNTALDVLTDDEPRAWVGSGGSHSIYYVLRSTTSMMLWAEDTPGFSTIDTFDLTPYAAVDALVLDVALAYAAPGGLKKRVYTANGISQVYPIPPPGDFNTDGRVDGADFLLWQRTDATPENLEIWKGGMPSAASIVSVPEPTTAVLVLVGLAAALFFANRVGKGRC